MKKYKKYAPIGLIIGLLGAVASLILRISLGQFTLSVQISIVISVLGLAAFIILDPETILHFFKGRQARYGSNSLVLSLAVIAILVIINLFIYNNNVSWDLTEDKVNSLAPETMEILDNLAIPIYAQAFYSSGVNSETANQLLRNFSDASDGMFSYEFIDPLTDPVAATQAGIERDATVVLLADDQIEKISGITEQKLVNAIIKLQNPDQAVVYVLTGHGELDFINPGDYSVTELLGVMEAKNYVVETLNLVANPEIPLDASAIIIAGPQVPLEQSEVNLIADFLAEGGALMVWYEPSFLTQFNVEEDPLAAYLAGNWGVSFGDNLVIDLSVDPAEIAIAEQYGQHPITEEVSGYITFYPTSRSVEISEAESVTSTALVKTSNRAWAETNIEGILNQEAGFDENDLEGPITLAAALENFANDSRLVVVGDSDFAADAFITSYANLDFATGMVDWVAENENLINLTPKQTTTRILIPPTRATRLGIILGGLLGIPLFIAATGIIIAIQRKRTG
jgi:ABC-type uncharacterized transport system involved in gliding motility auxiliary subunit